MSEPLDVYVTMTLSEAKELEKFIEHLMVTMHLDHLKTLHWLHNAVTRAIRTKEKK